jgi:hypothetical protein
MACLRRLTFAPERPDRSFPALISFIARSTLRPDCFEYFRVLFFRVAFLRVVVFRAAVFFRVVFLRTVFLRGAVFFCAMLARYCRAFGLKRGLCAYNGPMDNDVINEMNREEGVGEALGVDDDQRLDYLRQSEADDAAADEAKRTERESGDV